MKTLLTISSALYCLIGSSALAAEQNTILMASSFEQRLPYNGNLTVAYITCSFDSAVFIVSSKEFPKSQAYQRQVQSSAWSLAPFKVEQLGNSKYRITVSPRYVQVSPHEKCSDLEIKLVN